MLDIEKIISRGNKLFGAAERSNAESGWKEISEFMLNNQYSAFNNNTGSTTETLGTTKGEKTTRRLFDSTALQSTQDLASAFQGTLTNPATIWSKLRFQEEELNNDQEAVSWLERVNQTIHNELNESNFNTEIAKGYQSFVALANMVLFHEETENGKYVFTAVHIAKIVWAEDKNGLVDTVYRKFALTAKQAVEKFGKQVHVDILKDSIDDPDKEYAFIHCIAPRDRKDIKMNTLGVAPAKNRPIASVYIDMTNMKLVEEGGYYEMPVLVSRWSLLPGETYGRGPGHLALPDTRTLNRLKQRGLEAIDLQVRPPIFANQRDVMGKLDLRPGGISIVKDHSGIKEFVSQSRADILQFSLEDLKNSIKSIFFLDKLLLPPRNETGEMTAFEVSQRIEQMQRVLGPVLSRLNNELLSPLVVRSFKILLRSGRLPAVPEILRQRGINVDIVFVNQLARAQQIQDVSTIQQWIQGLLQIAQLNPQIVDMINTDGIAKHTARILGVPEVAVQNDKIVKAIRDQRQQAAQQAQQAEQATQAADIASKTKGLDQPQ